MNYFIITTNEDGDVYFEKLSKDQVLAVLKEEPDPSFSPDEDFDRFVNLTDSPKRILIKGEIIVPEPVEVVKEWKIK